MSPLLFRILLTFGLVVLGIGVYLLVNRVILFRAGRTNLGLKGFQSGKPAILYFTMEGCVPCRTTQRPALENLRVITGDQVQIIEVDVVEQPDLAESWGVLSVPTTFVIDPFGRPRRVNHGVTLAEKLINQLEQVSDRQLAVTETNNQVEIPASSPGMD